MPETNAVLPAVDPEEQLDEAESALPALWAYPATYGIIAANLLVYLVMYRAGPLPTILHAHPAFSTTNGNWREIAVWLARLFTAPFPGRVLVHFGACAPDRVLAAGEWWRLLSAIFVHITLLHLVLNMWCLWNLGIFGERLLGRPGLVAVYLLTGFGGMLQTVVHSLFSGRVAILSAGASGAVFGFAGILVVLLSNRKLNAPWEELRSLRLQVAFFALANLLLGALPSMLPRIAPELWQALHISPGALPQIDNSAHLGGLLSGLALGLALFPRLTSGKSTYRVRQAMVFTCAALLLSLVSYAVATYARGSGA